MILYCSPTSKTKGTGDSGTIGSGFVVWCLNPDWNFAFNNLDLSSLDYHNFPVIFPIK